MQLYFIRHAQSANNLLWDQTGASQGRSEDPQLTPTGWMQAERLAAFVSRSTARDNGGGTNGAPSTGNARAEITWAQSCQNVHGFGLTHVYASLMIRAMHTAALVARACGLPLHALADLHEAGGIYREDETSGERAGRAGQSRSYFLEQFPDCELPECVGDDGWWNRPWESPELRLPRAQRLWLELL
ncbi:MAG: histidine phosphatase family protein, partial [Chloroflexi bacterium]|nr:histidine phosphatase family protein [Chloroflexota bacterium]